MNKPIPNLRELFDLACANAKRIFLEEGEVSPIWHAVPKDPDEPQLLIATPWRGDDEKEMAIEAVRDMFKQYRVVRFVFVTEAWAVMGGDLATVFKGRPSQHPDRREILRVQAEDRNGDSLTGSYYILRPELGPVTLSPFKEDPANMVTTGRLSGMLAS